MSEPGGAAAPGSEFESIELADLRRRRSVKWATNPEDVLPAFVAEMDFALAPEIRATLGRALEPARHRLRGARPARRSVRGLFAQQRYGWRLDPDRVRPATDVMTAVAELLRALTAPGDAVVVNPPIYPPFRSVTAELGRRVVEAPLRPDAAGLELDLEALERRFAEGAAAYLMCHPHNPSGRSFGRVDLEAVAALADRHGVVVISDEVHAPLTLPGSTHLPYLALGGAAAVHGVAVAAASKAWNLAGLKCALIVSGSEEMDARLERALSPHLRYHVGHLGVLASLTAFEQGTPWLDGLLAHLDGNRRRLQTILGEALPEVGYVPPQAGYLAWLDCRPLDLGDDPAAAFLERGRVALSSGPLFGVEGNGFARLNFATSSAFLAEAVVRMAAAAGR